MALRITVGLFLHIFEFGLWLGKPSAAGLAQLFFVLRWEHVMVFQLRSRTFLLTMELLEVGIAVGLVHFVFSVESRILPLG